MGVSTLAVLVCSNIVISLLKNIIPDKVRIPCYIVVIAGFVTIVQLLLKAYLPALDAALGLFIPLIVVNCIILGRAEMFASKNSVLDSASRWTWHGYRLHAGSGSAWVLSENSWEPELLSIFLIYASTGIDTCRYFHAGSGRILRIRYPDRCHQLFH